MNFLLISDIHATDKTPISRKDIIMDTFVEKLDFVLDYAKKNNSIILQAGDFFDSSRNWTILDHLTRALSSRKVKIMAVFGQHDMYFRGDTKTTPTALLTLINTKLVQPLGQDPIRVGNEVDVYGSSFGEKVPKIINDEAKNILVIHKSISETSEWPGHEYQTPKYFLKKNNGFDLILVGDIHKEFCIENFQKRYIVNTGPMLRNEANKYNFTHAPCFYVWNSKTLDMIRVEIPHKDAESVLSRDHIGKNKVSIHELEELVKSLRKAGEIVSLRRNRIVQYIEENVEDKEVKEIMMEIINANKRKN